MTSVELSRLHFPVTTLGPGRRVGVWFQGCSIRCRGCISADTWATGRGGTTVEEIMGAIEPWAAVADGLTVSGGEPFDQPEALEALLRGWRAMSSADVLVFTGYDLEQVGPKIEGWPALIDALVAGPFLEGSPQTLALRGSDNQRLHILTPEGSHIRAYDRASRPDDRRLDVMFDADGGAWFAGIPNQGDFKRLRQALKLEGHQLISSDQSARTTP